MSTNLDILKKVFDVEFWQLATYEDGRTPLLLNEEQYNAAKSAITELERYKLMVLAYTNQKAVGEVTESNGVIGAVFYKGAELQAGELIYALPSTNAVNSGVESL